MTTATVQEGPETSLCLATDAACTDDCPCRPCRLRMETMNSSSTTSSTTDTEFGQASHDGWTSHESYAKRWPALEHQETQVPGKVYERRYRIKRSQLRNARDL